MPADFTINSPVLLLWAHRWLFATPELAITGIRGRHRLRFGSSHSKYGRASLGLSATN